MPRALAALILVAACLLVVLWLAGGFDGLSHWAQTAQRNFQTRMAQGLRALHAGDRGALAALWGLCFAYGFVHAIGPGHGKFLLGAYGAGTQVGLGRLVGVGLVASLAQALTAVLLVYAGVALFGLTRDALQATGAQILDRVSWAAIALIGAWLIWRGTRKMRATRAQHHHHHHHHHEHAHTCPDCGHAHAPSPAQIAAATHWRDTAALIGAIAIRPCTGALFLLILTWRMGLIWQGIAGALIMGLGTASVTMAIAALSVLTREGAFAFDTKGRLHRITPILEALAGAIIVIFALNMLKII